MKRVEVEASSRYDVLIGPGLLEEAGVYAAAATGARRVVLVADDRVDALYGARAAASLERAGFEVVRYRFPHGEGSKNLQELERLLEFLAEQGLTRADLIAALGGGVTGDLAGFAASVYLRGIRFIQLPTTLLAAVDSSVGGKTAVNLRGGKNMCGTFCQPALVVCDTDTFSTLAPEVFADGMSESLKYGVIADEALFEQFLKGRARDDLPALAARCIGIKAEVVAGDEFDHGQRQLLNFGHTFGHAVERLSGFAVSHGHAVAIGMAILCRAADRMGWSQSATAEPLVRALRACGLPHTTIYSPEALADAALSDKKRRGDAITLVVPERIGRCVLREVPVAELAAIARAGLEDL